PVDLPQLVFYQIIDGLIKGCPGTESCFPYRSSQLISIIRHRAENVNVLIESDNHHAVARPKLIYKRDRRILYLVDPELRRGADVDQHYDRERLLDRLKIIDLLLNAVLKDLKIILLQARDKSAVAVKHRNRHRNEVCLNLYDLVLVICLRRRSCRS